MGRWCACAAKACWGLKVQRQNITPASTLSNLARALASSFKRPGPVRALAPVTLVLPRVVVDAAHLARYAEVCGFAPSAQAPLTYPQMLTFPLVMTYMTSPACPWPAMGTVHLANAITQHAPLAAGDAVRVELSSGELLAHDKGQVFTLHLRVLRESDGEGDGQCVWQATQTLLRLGVKSPVGAPFNGAVGPELALTQAGAFDAPADTGRRYAPVSGDYNPIPLSALSARLFGFPRAIAHGLSTHAASRSICVPNSAPNPRINPPFPEPHHDPQQHPPSRRHRGWQPHPVCALQHRLQPRLQPRYAHGHAARPGGPLQPAWPAPGRRGRRRGDEAFARLQPGARSRALHHALARDPGLRPAAGLRHRAGGRHAGGAQNCGGPDRMRRGRRGGHHLGRAHRRQ